jgi:FAD/FMN-containing dehydrogenase/Fe-S oxidoreductase
MMLNKEQYSELKSEISGEVYTDNSHLTIYSTDASAYREKPKAVVIPKSKEDILKVIQFAIKYKHTLIPRTAGTSIAGQVVGNGIIVDTSKYMTKILEINTEEKWVRVEPGVVLDELNMNLKKHGLFFGPETSTSNRCMVGGMVGNNSCGAHSLIYGSTRDHTIEIKGYLSNGSEAVFGALSSDEFKMKCHLDTLEGKIYQNIQSILSDSTNANQIIQEFPDPRLHRRNTGYAIDLLLNTEPFNKGGEKFNFCKLLAGSEGTLMFSTEIKLNCVDLPPKETGLLVVHLNTVEESLKANLIALKYKPVAIELIDNFILECTKHSIEHSKNRFFLQGDPGALLCVEFAFHNKEEVESCTKELINELKENAYGYYFPVLYGADIAKVWGLRKAGLGLLSNIPGDAKPVPVIEDTAVLPEYLPDYISDLNKVLAANNLNCVYYAHIATGELHLRPVINLKTIEGVRLFHTIALETAKLVKKYKGSISGEHGDGRLRGEFIPLMIGDKNYQLLKDVKNAWDPNGIFNSGKITDTPPMTSSMRFMPGQITPEFDTILDFSEDLGFIRLAEKCNGSGDCRKSSIIGGTMCPTYQVTQDEDKTTRARANMLREIINGSKKENPFNDNELYKVLDLCISCKGCKSECPSGVDMAKLKTEFLFQFYKSNRIPIRTWLIGNFSKLQSLASNISSIYNFTTQNKIIAIPVKRLIGFAKNRSLPKVYRKTLKKYINKNLASLNEGCKSNATNIFLFIDEFSNYNDVPIGIKAIKLLNHLGYRITVFNNFESGRPYISKGLLKQARELARKNVTLYSDFVNENSPLVGIEPSAILTFRDEYPDLLRGMEKEKARKLASNTFTFEEFILKEAKLGKVTKENFTYEHRQIMFHGHCQQKAISTTHATKLVLQLPENYSVEEIKTGCCGMAGSFGYEKEHYDLSMKIGEMILFPSVRQNQLNKIIVAAGTSCRHHIKDGTGVKAVHPVEVLYDALK